MDLISNLPICNRPSPTLVLPVPYVGYVTSHLAFFPICRISSSLCSSRLISSHLITSIRSKRRVIYISHFWYINYLSINHIASWKRSLKKIQFENDIELTLGNNKNRTFFDAFERRLIHSLGLYIFDVFKCKPHCWGWSLKLYWYHVNSFMGHV